MHIAFIFSGNQLADKELRLISGARQLPGVSAVTIAVVRESRGVVTYAERLRANIERRVARQSLVQKSWTELHDVIVLNCESVTAAATQLADVDRIVNLSGDCWPESTQFASVLFELLWDGKHPRGLGQRSARGRSPRDLVVTCRVATGQKHVVQRSTLTRTPATPAGDRRNASSRSVTLLLRALSETDSELSATGSNAAPPHHASDDSMLSRVLPTLAASLSVVSAAIVRRANRPLWRDDVWEIQYRTNAAAFIANTARITAEGFKPYRAGFNKFVADPIAFSHNGVHAVFFEEYPFDSSKGVISCAVLQQDGDLSSSTLVLEQPYHLSYPFVFRDAEHVYMVPESAVNNTIDLYVCTNFPFQWEFKKTLLNNISANDATLYHDGARWWMFATVSTDGAYAWDELHLFFADDLLGEWTPHAKNPVKCDSRSARPAGPIFVKSGKLMRPTQDCSQSYGGAVNICEIDELSPDEFRERVVDRLDPVLFPGMQKLHTFAAIPALEVIDLQPASRMRWQRGTV